jgi:murein L,D-transpeptidase YcbB/YkuD
VAETSYRRHFSWLAVGLCLLMCGMVSPGAAQEPDATDLKSRLSALTRPESRRIGSADIAGYNFLPKLYAALNYQPVWSPANTAALSKAIALSWEDGLVPADFHSDYVKAAIAGTAAEGAVDRELILSDALVRLLYQLYFGKVAPNGLDPNWNFERPVLSEDPVASITAALREEKLADLFDKVTLKHPLYIELKSLLQQYTDYEVRGGWPTVPDGPSLKPGQTDPRISALRERLSVTGEWQKGPEASDPESYDPSLVEGVKLFQTLHGLDPDGVLGPGTLAVLNVPVSTRIAQIRANLERARWLLRTMGPEAVIVNVAGFYLHVFLKSEKVWSTRVIVGQSFTKTPIFTEPMRTVVLNPDWTVPQSIVRNEIFAKAAANPGYLAAGNYEVIDNSGKPVGPVDFAAYTATTFPYRIRQQPGPKNALGLVKFLFPNKHSVYLHDTPSRQLFDKAGRTFSHGCIRVEDPLKLADIILGDRLGWSRSKVDGIVAGGKMQSVGLPKPLPVLILYWTVDPSPQNGTAFYADVYGRDAVLIKALNAPFKPATR